MIIETSFEKILKCQYNIMKIKYFYIFYYNIVCKNIVCDVGLNMNKVWAI